MRIIISADEELKSCGVMDVEWLYNGVDPLYHEFAGKKIYCMSGTSKQILGMLKYVKCRIITVYTATFADLIELDKIKYGRIKIMKMEYDKNTFADTVFTNIWYYSTKKSNPDVLVHFKNIMSNAIDESTTSDAIIHRLKNNEIEKFSLFIITNTELFNKFLMSIDRLSELSVSNISEEMIQVIASKDISSLTIDRGRTCLNIDPILSSPYIKNFVIYRNFYYSQDVDIQIHRFKHYDRKKYADIISKCRANKQEYRLARTKAIMPEEQ